MEGIVDWTDAAVLFITYVHVATKETMQVWLRGSVPFGKSTLKLSALGQSVVLLKVKG